MPEPTDHRAEAEKWLTRTERLVGENEDDETMTILLSLAHALLALGQPPAYSQLPGAVQPFQAARPARSDTE